MGAMAEAVQSSRLVMLGCDEYTSTDGWIFSEPAVMTVTKDAGLNGEVRSQVSDIRNQV